MKLITCPCNRHRCIKLLIIVPPDDNSSSSTFELIEDASPFHIDYGDKSSYDRELIAETLQIGNTTMENVTMAVVKSISKYH